MVDCLRLHFLLIESKYEGIWFTFSNTYTFCVVYFGHVPTFISRMYCLPWVSYRFYEIEITKNKKYMSLRWISRHTQPVITYLFDQYILVGHRNQNILGYLITYYVFLCRKDVRGLKMWRCLRETFMRVSRSKTT